MNLKKLDYPKKYKKQFKKLSYKSNEERLISILQFVLNNDEIEKKINSKINMLHDKAFFGKKNELDEYELHIKNTEDFLSYKELDMISNNQTISLSRIIKFTIETIIKTYSLSFIDLFTTSNMSILKDDKIFQISPIIFDNKSWKYLIKYELAILKNKDLIAPKIENYIAVLEDLKYQLDYNKIPKIYSMDIPYEYNNNYCFLRKEQFTEPIKYYLDFLKNIDIKELSTSNLKETIKLLQNENKRAVVILEPYTKENIKHITSIFNKDYSSKSTFSNINFFKWATNRSIKKPENKQNISREELKDLLALCKFFKEKQMLKFKLEPLTKLINIFFKTGITTHRIKQIHNKENLAVKIKYDLNIVLQSKALSKK